MLILLLSLIHKILQHNYARWNGAIIGQGGPTNAQFATLWSQVAAKVSVLQGRGGSYAKLRLSKYASNSKIIVSDHLDF